MEPNKLEHLATESLQVHFRDVRVKALVYVRMRCLQGKRWIDVATTKTSAGRFVAILYQRYGRPK